MHHLDLHLLAQELEAHGFVGHDTAIDAVSRSARAAGLSPVLIDVLTDPTQPEIARLRAFGMLASRLVNGPSRIVPEPDRGARRRHRRGHHHAVAPAA